MAKLETKMVYYDNNDCHESFESVGILGKAVMLTVMKTVIKTAAVALAVAVDMMAEELC